MKYYVAPRIDVGINKQLPSNEVQWADGRNIRFKAGEVNKSLGKTFACQIARGLQGIFSFYDRTSFNKITLFCGGGKIYRTFNDDLTLSIDTSPIYSGYEGQLSFMIIANIQVVNSAYYYTIKISNGIVSALQNAPGFLTGVVHKHRILAGNVKAVNNNKWPGRIAWSGPANPEQWCYDIHGDTTLITQGKAGFIDLLSPQSGYATTERIQRLVVVGGTPFAFTEKLLWMLESRPSPKLYASVPVRTEVELISPTAVACTPNSEDELVYFMDRKGFFSLSSNGQVQEMPWDIRDYALSILNYNSLNRIFAFKNPSTHEVWFCVPTNVSALANQNPDTAFVYNEELKCWSICDCDFTAFGTIGDITKPQHLCGNAYGQIMRFDDSFDNNLYPINAWIESGDNCLSTQGKSLDYINKYILEVWPQFGLMERDNLVYIQIGTKERLLDPINWSAPFEFKLGTSTFAEFREQAKWFRVRFRTWQKNSPFSLRGYQVGYELGGLR